MPDSPDKQATNAAAQEGRMAALRGETTDSCPYGDIGGLIAQQRAAWMGGFNGR